MSGHGDTTVVDVRATAEWQDLVDRHAAVRDRHLRDLFAADPDRGTRMVARGRDLVLDYAKHRVDDEALAALSQWPDGPGCPSVATPCSPGARINTTEDRSVLHVALRMPRDATLEVDGRDVVADVHTVLDRHGLVAERIRSGAWTGQTGRAHPGRREHRDRRLRPRTGHGPRGAP